MRLRQAFFGYIGPNGPLPIHLADFVRERVLQGGDHGFSRWGDYLDAVIAFAGLDTGGTR